MGSPKRPRHAWISEDIVVRSPQKLKLKRDEGGALIKPKQMSSLKDLVVYASNELILKKDENGALLKPKHSSLMRELHLQKMKQRYQTACKTRNKVKRDVKVL